MTDSSAEARPRKLVPVSQTIPILTTDAARVYRHIHPALILALYYLCFPTLVADPVSTLWLSILPLALLQIVYCLLCLPPSSGRSTSQPTPSKTPKKKRVQFAKPPATLASNIIVIHPQYAPYEHSYACFANVFGPHHIASHTLSPCLPLSCCSSPHHTTYPFRRAFDYTFLAQPPVRDAYVAPWCPASILRPWSRCTYVEGNLRRMFAFRRGLGWIGRNSFRGLAWRCAYTIGLVSHQSYSLFGRCYSVQLSARKSYLW